MCNDQLRNVIDELLKHCTCKIQILSQLEVCDKINEVQTETDISPDEVYNELSNIIFTLLLKEGKNELAYELNRLSKESYGTISFYEKTKRLLKEILQ